MKPKAAAVMRGVRGGLSLALLVALGCGDRLELPEGPEMAPLNEEYNYPTGTVTEESLPEVMSHLEGNLEQIEVLSRLGFVIDELDAVLETVASASGGDSDDSRLKFRGSTFAEAVCPGEDGVARPANGTLTINVVYEEALLNPVIWGQFNQCTFNSSVGPVTVDGDLGIYLGETQPIFDISLDLLLVHVLGTVTFEGTEHDVDLSFRLIDERLLEVAIPADNGDVVFDLAEGLETSALRTGNGSFCCWFADRQCASVASETCEGEPGDNVWTW